MKLRRAVVVLFLSGWVGAGSIAAQGEKGPRPDPANTVFLDNGPGAENGSTKYDPDTRTCGRGKYRVFSDPVQAVEALQQADVLYLRAGTYSREVTPNVRVHGSDVNYWEGALATHVTGTPQKHTVVRVSCLSASSQNLQ